MGITYCPGCGSALLLDAQRYCATCGFDLEGLRERARSARADGNRARPVTDTQSAAAASQTVEPLAAPEPPAIQAAAVPVGSVLAPEGSQGHALDTRSTQRAPLPRTSEARSRRRPLVALGGLVLVLVSAGVGYVVLSNHGSGSAQPQSVGLVSPSLDPDALAFPVPTGSTVLNAQMEGSGQAAYRMVAWQSGTDYATTTNFYSSLSDSRWQPMASPTVTPQATDLTFSDSQGVFAKAEIEIARTDPVRIEARFLPPSGSAAASFAAGPTIAFGPLPHATSLPEGFPAAFVLSGTSLHDASSIGSTYFAIFAGTVDPAAYLAQIQAVSPDAHTTSTGSVTTIDFTYDGHPGEATVDVASGQVSLEVTK
jgi:hypothetical protein